ncbi:MAG: restriction endonuclease subunit S [Novosphingobium sp.]
MSAVAELVREADDLPGGWRISTIGETADILDKLRVPLNSEERRRRQGQYPYWGANGIVDYIDDFIFDEPLVLMAEDGGYFHEAASRPICHRLDGRAWVNNHAHIIRPTGADRDYFYYWFVHRDITPYIKGGTRSKLNQADLKRLPILLPPLDEQRRIAEVLRSVDEAIAAGEAAHQQSCETLRAARTDLVGLNGGKAHWAARPILDCFQLQRGHDLPVQKREPGDVPVIASNGPVGAHNVAAIPGPCVVTGRSGTIGKVSYFAGPSWPLNTTLYVKDFRGSDPRFVFHFLSAFPLQDYQSGTGVPTLNRNDVHAVDVFWPPKEEQEMVAKALDRLERAVGDAEDALRSLVGVKRSLMSDLLSGRVRVPA